jgi:hypothetical protein
MAIRQGDVMKHPEVLIRCEFCDEVTHIEDYYLPEWQIELDGLSHLSEHERNIVACKLIANMSGFFQYIEEILDTVGVKIEISVVMEPRKEGHKDDIIQA